MAMNLYDEFILASEEDPARKKQIIEEGNYENLYFHDAINEDEPLNQDELAQDAIFQRSAAASIANSPYVQPEYTPQEVEMAQEILQTPNAEEEYTPEVIEMAQEIVTVEEAKQFKFYLDG